MCQAATPNVEKMSKSFVIRVHRSKATPAATGTSPVMAMLPIMRRRATWRGVSSLALFRWVVTACCAKIPSGVVGFVGEMCSLATLSSSRLFWLLSCAFKFSRFRMCGSIYLAAMSCHVGLPSEGFRHETNGFRFFYFP